jgi:GWxTD domain-containing protein
MFKIEGAPFSGRVDVRPRVCLFSIVQQRRKAGLILVLAVILSARPTLAQTLPELFQQMKAQVGRGSWTEAKTTLMRLQTESEKPGNEDAHSKLKVPIAFYRGVCDASLGHTDEAIEDFIGYLRLQPNATVDSTTYPPKVVAAFEKARSQAAAHAPGLAEAYEAFELPSDAMERDPADKYWAHGPVKWIMTDDEKGEWSRVSDPNARATFVARFWATRDALPGSSGRLYREEFTRRVAFSDAVFADEGEKRGSLTDRGMVFILLGPPSRSSRRSLRGGQPEIDQGGLSRVGSQDATIAMKPGAGASAQKSGDRAKQFDRYVAPENRAANVDDEELEIWHYEDNQILGPAFMVLDVHYVSKRRHGRGVLERDTTTLNALGAAARRAHPASRP